MLYEPHWVALRCYTEELGGRLPLWWEERMCWEELGRFNFSRHWLHWRTGVRGQCRLSAIMCCCWFGKWHLLWEVLSLSPTADLNQPCLSDFAKCFLWHCSNVFTKARRRTGEKREVFWWMDHVAEELEVLFLPCCSPLFVSVASPVISGCHQAPRLLLDWCLFPVLGASRELYSEFLRLKGLTVSTVFSWKGAYSVSSWKLGTDHASLWQTRAP